MWREQRDPSLAPVSRASKKEKEKRLKNAAEGKLNSESGDNGRAARNISCA